MIGSSSRLVRNTALVFLVLAPVSLVAFYYGQRSVIDSSLDYYAPDFSGSAPDQRALESLRCGPTVYVPAYSHIFWGDGRGVLLSITLSVRNTSADTPMLLKGIEYYDTDGEVLKSEIESPVLLGPMATATFLVEESDVSGGVGANFVVRTGIERDSPPPIVEAIMVGPTASGTISFVRPGQVIDEACE